MKGDISLKNVSVRYRKELPLVIKNLSVSIKHLTKVGIVGRTGSGKSTLFFLLTKILEIEKTSNSLIKIDNQDISTVNLE